MSLIMSDNRAFGLVDQAAASVGRDGAISQSHGSAEAHGVVCATFAGLSRG